METPIKPEAKTPITAQKAVHAVELLWALVGEARVTRGDHNQAAHAYTDLREFIAAADKPQNVLEIKQ